MPAGEPGGPARRRRRCTKCWSENFIASFERAPKRLVLDVDATDDRVHGDQEGRFFHGYYDHYCFLPLYVFCGERLLVSYLRPEQDRRGEAQLGGAGAADQAAAAGVAGGRDHGARGLRLLPLAHAALVRPPRRRLRHRRGEEPAPAGAIVRAASLGGGSLSGDGREAEAVRRGALRRARLGRRPARDRQRPSTAPGAATRASW